MTDLTGKTALVTGGSRGLGKDIALRLAEAGADIVLTYRTGAKEGAEVARAIEEMGRKAVALPVDLEGAGDIPRFTGEFKTALNEINGGDTFDILINNAGMAKPGVIGGVTEEDFDTQFDTNVKSVLFLTQALLPHLNDGGRIVLIGSGLSRFSMPPYIVYGATKAAIDGFARYLAKSLGGRGITANVVAPGALDTDFNRARFEAEPAVVEMLKSATALGRIGHAEDIGGIVSFLCSDDAGWINGQRIEASGGIYL